MSYPDFPGAYPDPGDPGRPGQSGRHGRDYGAGDHGWDRGGAPQGGRPGRRAARAQPPRGRMSARDRLAAQLGTGQPGGGPGGYPDSPARAAAAGFPRGRNGGGNGHGGNGRGRGGLAAPERRLVAALDLEEGRWPVAGHRGRVHHPARHRLLLRVLLDHDPGRVLVRHGPGVPGLLPGRPHPGRHDRQHQPADPQLQSDPDHGQARHGGLRGQALLRRGRRLADRHDPRRHHRPDQREGPAGRLDHHPAAGAQLLPGHRRLGDRDPEDQGDPGRGESWLVRSPRTGSSPTT